jgi:zinc protease
VKRISLFLLLFAIVCAVAPSSQAQDVFETEIENIHSTFLENGLEVVVIEDHTLPIVAIEIAVHNGAFTEPPELNGLSHLYEHMFFKGNRAIPDQGAYMARQRELGMLWNGTTGTERVNYFFTLGSEHLCAGMVFMSNAIRTPLFDPDELEREREVVLGEFDRNEANPYYHLRYATDQELWYEYPSRKDSLGDRPTIGSATPEQMAWLQERYYVPNNSSLFLAGDVTPEVGFALAETLFGSWERGPDPFVLEPPVEHPALPASVVRIVEQDVQIATITISWHGPSIRRDVQGTFAADVFSFIITQSAHRFQQNLVDSGLALSAGLSYYTQAGTGPISLTVQFLPSNFESVLAAVREEIDHFADPDYFSDEQIETAKTLLAVSELYSRQQSTDWVHTVSFWWAVAGLDYYREYVRNLQAVTREEIERYVTTYIQNQPYVLGALMNPLVRADTEMSDQDLFDWFGN